MAKLLMNYAPFASGCTQIGYEDSVVLPGQ
jgi:hypothetical protein